MIRVAAVVLAGVAAHGAHHDAAAGSCFGASRGRYALNWSAAGATFFDDFDFGTEDFNSGATEYVNRTVAVEEGLAVAGDTHAIVRIGNRSETHALKRKSVRLVTKRNWKYYLMALRFSAVPYGLGIWPAFWMNGADTVWPEGGELDILEYANSEQSKVSMHVGENNTCKLNGEEVTKCGPMPDTNGMDYNCVTNYSAKEFGCGPTNSNGQRAGERWSKSPGVIAVEWTAEFARVFYIPEAEIPADLESDQPVPDGWDKWVISYFPFAASERRDPGSCQSPENVLAAQQIILNVGMCGDWAGWTWSPSSSAPNFAKWSYDYLMGKCKLSKQSVADDCCTQFINDPGTDDYLQQQGFFNISWAKVYQVAKASPEPVPEVAIVV